MDSYLNKIILFASLFLLSFAGFCFQSNFKQLYIRGTNNGWANSEMRLVADHTWQIGVSFTQGSNKFKFDVNGDWNENYGDSNVDGKADLNGNNIRVTQKGHYWVKFNDETFSYSLEKQRRPNRIPVADAGAEINIKLGDMAQFSAVRSRDSDGKIVRYQWSNGLEGVAPSLQYNEIGHYTVVLTVTDDKGDIAVDTVEVTVSVNSTDYNFPQLYLRGTNNGWGKTAFIGTGDHIWELEAHFGNANDERFKFDVNGDWSVNYGDENSDGVAELSAGDIHITEGPGLYKIHFNDKTFAYSVTKLR